MDADALPDALNRPDQQKAMGVLKMLAQSDVERELYEGRLKAKRDMQTLETLRDQWQQRYEAANRERDEARKQGFVRQIQLCQRLLKRAVLGTDELLARGTDELQAEAERLEREVTEKAGPA